MGVMRIFSNRLSIINKKVEGVQDGGRSTGHEEARGAERARLPPKFMLCLSRTENIGGLISGARKGGEGERAHVEREKQREPKWRPKGESEVFMLNIFPCHSILEANDMSWGVGFKPYDPEGYTLHKKSAK